MIGLRLSLDDLIAAYPDALAGHDGKALHWRDGTVMPVFDGADGKSLPELLRHASIVDQFRIPYPRGPLQQPPAVDADPGRFRNTAFFAKMYGDCQKGEVLPHLVSRRVASQDLGQINPRHFGQRGRRASACGLGRDRCTTRKDQTCGIPDRRYLQLPGRGRYRPAEPAQLRYCDRSQYRVLGLLVLAAAWQPDRLSQPHARSDRRHLRKARLHLGRQVVSLRYDALRISARTSYHSALSSHRVCQRR